jgi:hypothetical protein
MPRAYRRGNSRLVNDFWLFGADATKEVAYYDNKETQADKISGGDK